LVKKFILLAVLCAAYQSRINKELATLCRVPTRNAPACVCIDWKLILLAGYAPCPPIKAGKGFMPLNSYFIHNFASSFDL
jgi:hypothetical protein